MGTKIKRTIKCLMHYDVHDSDEKRECSLAAATKAEYIFSCILRAGYKINLLSASNTYGRKNVKHNYRIIDDDFILELLPGLGRGCRIKNLFSTFLFQLTLWLRLLFFIKNGDVLWVYHSLILIPPIRFIKKIKKFKLILEVEELYGDVSESKVTTAREIQFAQFADAFIFPSEELNKRVNVAGKPYVISHGTYQMVQSSREHFFDDSKIHVVYSGTMDPRKGGVFAAMDAAKYLPEYYHMHILGAKTKEAGEYLNKTVRKCECTLTYDGVFRGNQYTEFLQKCQIGLSTQNPAAAFNASSFPSKILAYMSSGLRVVSARIPVVENSGIGKYVHYYDVQEGKNIAETILAIDLHDDYDGKEIIRKLDAIFLTDLGEMIDYLEYEDNK